MKLALIFSILCTSLPAMALKVGDTLTIRVTKPDTYEQGPKIETQVVTEQPRWTKLVVHARAFVEHTGESMGERDFVVDSNVINKREHILDNCVALGGNPQTIRTGLGNMRVCHMQRYSKEVEGQSQKIIDSYYGNVPGGIVREECHVVATGKLHELVEMLTFKKIP